MGEIEILGFVAAFFTTVSFVPQAIKVIKTRDTHSLSLAMYSIFTVGVALWLVYGVYRNDIAIVLANAITLSLALTILVTKVRNDVLHSRAESER